MKLSRERSLKKEIKKEHLMNFKVDKDFKNNYQEHCTKNGYSMAKRIRALMKADVENKIKI